MPTLPLCPLRRTSQLVRFNLGCGGARSLPTLPRNRKSSTSLRSRFGASASTSSSSPTDPSLSGTNPGPGPGGSFGQAGPSIHSKSPLGGITSSRRAFTPRSCSHNSPTSEEKTFGKCSFITSSRSASCSPRGSLTPSESAAWFW